MATPSPRTAALPVGVLVRMVAATVAGILPVFLTGAVAVQAGHDLDFDDPRFVSLELELFVCVASGHFRSDVRRRLLDVLSSRNLPDGTRGLFHPDNFSFGQTIYLSPILAAARAVPGVSSAEIKVFQRQGIPDRQYLADGRLALENGAFTLPLEAGDNEVVVGVANAFFGWGLMLRLDDVGSVTLAAPSR